jgi:DNA-binding transcriptional ArsR family regulator
MTPDENDAKLFKTLSHPTRLAILDLLRAGEACVCHLEAALGYRQAYISQHLMVLRDAGLVSDRREGSNVYYHVTRPQVYAVLAAGRQCTAPEPAEGGLDQLEVAAPPLANCACPHCTPEKAL